MHLPSRISRLRLRQQTEGKACNKEAYRPLGCRDCGQSPRKKRKAQSGGKALKRKIQGYKNKGYKKESKPT